MTEIEQDGLMPENGLHSLLLLDLHRQMFHVRVFEVKTQVLHAEVEVRAIRRKSVGRQRHRLWSEREKTISNELTELNKDQ